MRTPTLLLTAILACAAAGPAAAGLHLAHAADTPHEHPAPQGVCIVTCIDPDGRHVPCAVLGGVCIDTYGTLTEATAMPYATRADLVARFGADEIDMLAPADDAGVSARADAVLADTDAEFDAVLSDRFDLPLPPGTYPLLTAAACDVARGRLYDDTAPERVLGRMSSARKRVARVAAGELHLVDAAGARVAPRSGVIATSAAPRFRRAAFEAPARGSRWDVR